MERWIFDEATGDWMVDDGNASSAIGVYSAMVRVDSSSRAAVSTTGSTIGATTGSTTGSNTVFTTGATDTSGAEKRSLETTSDDPKRVKSSEVVRRLVYDVAKLQPLVRRRFRHAVKNVQSYVMRPAFRAATHVCCFYGQIRISVRMSTEGVVFSVEKNRPRPIGFPKLTAGQLQTAVQACSRILRINTTALLDRGWRRVFLVHSAIPHMPFPDPQWTLMVMDNTFRWFCGGTLDFSVRLHIFVNQDDLEIAKTDDSIHADIYDSDLVTVQNVLTFGDLLTEMTTQRTSFGASGHLICDTPERFEFNYDGSHLFAGIRRLHVRGIYNYDDLSEDIAGRGIAGSTVSAHCVWKAVKLTIFAVHTPLL